MKLLLYFLLSFPVLIPYLQAADAATAATRLLDMILLDSDQQRRTNLRFRPELVRVRELREEGEDEKALEAFQQYFMRKMAFPEDYGISSAQLELSAEGVAGFDAYPPPLLRREHLNSLPFMAAADLLMDGKIRRRDAVIDLGEPFEVDWSDEARGDGDRNFPSDMQGLRTGAAFTPLALAFLHTRDRRYLNRWVRYMDDWARHATYYDQQINPVNVPMQAASVNFNVIHYFRILRALAKALPEENGGIPPEVFARVTAKIVREFPPVNFAYTRSNTHNWTPTGIPLLIGLLINEFEVAELYFREGRRRNIEDPAFTQNLPDGTETQQCPWYNDRYLLVASATGLIRDLHRMGRPWTHLSWAADVLNHTYLLHSGIDEHLRGRADFLLRLVTPQGEGPIGARGDKRSVTARGRESMRMVPDLLHDHENLAVAMATVGNTNHPRPSFYDEFWPYGGFRIVRQGWSADAGYGFMFSSPQPGSYGGQRSRRNNNSFGMAAYGQDIIVDGVHGHYTPGESPLIIDGIQQFFHAGLYGYPEGAGHKAWLQRSWREPHDTRWHSDPYMNIMEGFYNGPFGNFSAPVPLERTEQDWSHRRLVFYAREANIWAVADRVKAPGDHTFTLRWRLPAAPADGSWNVYEEDDLIWNPEEGLLRTVKDDAVNLDLHTFGISGLTGRREYENPRGRRLYAHWRMDFEWSGVDEDTALTAMHPRAPGQMTFAETEDISDAERAGFRITSPDGWNVSLQTARRIPARFSIGNLSADAEALYVIRHPDGTGRGALLGAERLYSGDLTAVPPRADFTFELDANGLNNLNPVYRPIHPVRIAPEADVFVEKTEITLHSATENIEIRYTLDNTDPTPQSTLYTGPFTLEHTAVVKARAFRPGVSETPPVADSTHASVVSRAVFRKTRMLEAVRAHNLEPGLEALYFTGNWKDLVWFLPGQTPVDRQRVPEPFRFPLGSDGEAYAYQYRGFIQIPESGVYTFHAPDEAVWPDIEAGYELNLFVGHDQYRAGNQWRNTGVLNRWYPGTSAHGFGTWSIALEAGLHPFELHYADFRGNSVDQLNKPGIRPFVWAGTVPDLRVSGPGLSTPRPLPAEWFHAPSASPAR